MPARLLPKSHGGFVINNNIQVHHSQMVLPKALETPSDHRPGETLPPQILSNHDMLEESTAAIVTGQGAAHKLAVIDCDDAQTRVSGK